MTDGNDALVGPDLVELLGADALELVGRMGEHLAAAPPATLRHQVLAAARTARPALAAVDAPRQASPHETFVAQVERFGALVEGLHGQVFDQPAAPYHWTVHGLVAHLVAVERHFAEAAGVPGIVGPTERVEDHLAMSEPTVAVELARSPAETCATWRAAAELTIDHLRDADVEQRVLFNGLDMSLGSALLARSFEIWTHADDIRRAAGLAEEAPPPEELRAMSDLSVRSLPLLDLLAGTAVLPMAARVVLTGDGGGAWDVELAIGPDEEPPAPSVTLVADVVDWCRVVARRIAPDELEASVHGAAPDALRLLVAAGALAV